MRGDVSSQQVGVQVFSFQSRKSRPTLQAYLLQTHPGIILSPLIIEKLKPVGQLVPLLWSQNFIHGSVQCPFFFSAEGCQRRYVYW